MDLRSYTKQELALLYFPDSDPDVARAHLMRWIVRCTQLYEQLKKSGYNKSCKEFNPLQVSYIFFHLGEPWYLSVIIGEYRWATMSIGELGKRNVVSLHCDSERVSHRFAQILSLQQRFSLSFAAIDISLHANYALILLNTNCTNYTNMLLSL